MGILFTLTPDVIQIAKDGISDLINQLGKVCQLVYPPNFVPCQCGQIPNSVQSNNIWTSGSPTFLPDDTSCPLCIDTGQIANQVTTNVVLLCEWSERSWYKPLPKEIDMGASTLQTKGFVIDAEAVQQSREMVLQPSLSTVNTYRFKLNSEIIFPGNIVQGAFFYCLWRRAGG